MKACLELPFHVRAREIFQRQLHGKTRPLALVDGEHHLQSVAAGPRVHVGRAVVLDRVGHVGVEVGSLSPAIPSSPSRSSAKSQTSISLVEVPPSLAVPDSPNRYSVSSRFLGNTLEVPSTVATDPSANVSTATPTSSASR